MSTKLQFETPENVQIEYEPAGLGTRFVAWFVDQVLLILATVLAFILLLVTGISFEGVFELLEGSAGDSEDTAVAYAVGLMVLIWGLGSFLYFGLSELLGRGQTLGKRLTRIRVVKADGFALDGASILVRNLFRVADHFSPLWIVPLLSKRSQRIGDMVAGTVVVADDPQDLTQVRTRLAERSAAEAEFRFDRAALGRLSPGDVEAIERVLDRWHELPAQQQESLLQQLIDALASKLQVEPPPHDRRVHFLEDLLAAELRRRSRALG